MPSRPQRTQQFGQRLLLQAAQTGGRFVQHDEQRACGQCARHFEHALLPERQIAGKIVCLVRKPDALELAHGIPIDRSLLGAIELQGSGKKPRMRARGSCQA